MTFGRDRPAWALWRGAPLGAHHPAMDPIVSADALVALLGSGAPLVVLDVRRSHDAYLASHLAGAPWVDLDRDLAAPVADAAEGGRHPLPAPEDFAATLTALGVTEDVEVVLYDDQGGGLAAARAWWMLRAFGHERARVLDGGLAAIEDAARAGRLALATGPTPRAVAPRPYPVRAWSRPRVTRDEVEHVRRAADWLLLDVRAANRYRGESETLDPVAGHIEGAVNAPYASTNLDARGRFLDAAALRARYAAIVGDRSMDRVVVSCGSGVTACHTLLALERAGLTGASLYVGSWGEWCRREGSARATGAAPAPSAT